MHVFLKLNLTHKVTAHSFPRNLRTRTWAKFPPAFLCTGRRDSYAVVLVPKSQGCKFHRERMGPELNPCLAPGRCSSWGIVLLFSLRTSDLNQIAVTFTLFLWRKTSSLHKELSPWLLQDNNWDAVPEPRSLGSTKWLAPKIALQRRLSTQLTGWGLLCLLAFCLHSCWWPNPRCNFDFICPLSSSSHLTEMSTNMEVELERYHAILKITCLGACWWVPPALPIHGLHFCVFKQLHIQKKITSILKTKDFCLYHPLNNTVQQLLTWHLHWVRYYK
jgi:hypothetical protein